MAQRAIAVRTYVLVCVLLVLLTVLTVAVSFLRLAGAWHVVVGLLIGACKAVLVLLFFMHVIVSPKLTWIVILVMTFWMVILFGLTLADYLSRDMILFTPGH
jgi:cytochrome c oxidase subunit 4